MAKKDACPTTGIRKILVATDASRESTAAVTEAIKMAQICGSRLFILSVIETNPEFEALAPGYADQAEIKMSRHLHALKAKAEKQGIACQAFLHQGDEPYRLIVDEARRMKADLIVLGSHGRTGLKRLLMGSVTARVIGHAPCKVLVVPGRS